MHAYMYKRMYMLPPAPPAHICVTPSDVFRGATSMKKKMMRLSLLTLFLESLEEHSVYVDGRNEYVNQRINACYQ